MPDDETFDTARGQLGEAKRIRPSDVPSLAAASGTLPFTALDERQNRMSTERREGGPELDDGGGASNPDVAPTGCAPAPSDG